jgi:hypothetical protein
MFQHKHFYLQTDRFISPALCEWERHQRLNSALSSKMDY